MTATDPEAVADSAEAREPRDGGQNVREDPRSVWRRIDRADAARTLFTGLCAAVTAFASAWPDRRWPAVAVVGLAVGCWPIAAEAWEDLRHRKMSMELSMLIAVVAAGAIGEWVTSLVIAAFVLAAEILEDLSKDRGRDALTDLMAFLPETVRVRRGDGTQGLPLAEVRPGDVVVVAPGGRVPVDGTVAAGRSSVDQSRITGEPLPVDVSAGETVYAGSINRVGALEIRAERVGSDSSYGRIVEAIRRAQSSQAPVQRLADRFAAYLVYLALAGAAVTFAVTRDWTATISVVVVAGACGIAAGTPLAVLAAIARVARSGAFVKDGAHLEALSQADAIVFDKTGTLTAGAPAVSKVLPAPGTSPEDLLTVLAAAESYSEHPLGEAVVEHARSLGLPVAVPEAFEYEPGLGIRARVGGRAVAAGGSALVPDVPEAAEEGGEGVVTPIHVDVDGAYAGTVLLADAVRGSARQAVAALRAMGLEVSMVTGDREPTARAVARQLGIDRVHAGLLPDEKMTVVDALRSQGRRGAMIGDGVNDAPALARADVGIAMGSGTDVARDSADVVLISSNLDDLVATVAVARRARRIVAFNFAGTVAVDLLGMMLAGIGLLTPILAALVHVGSETAFILNSARLIPGRVRRSRRA